MTIRYQTIARLSDGAVEGLTRWLHENLHALSSVNDKNYRALIRAFTDSEIHLYDGQFSESMLVRVYGIRRPQIAEIAKLGLLVPVAADGEGARYVIKDYLSYCQSKARVIAERERAERRNAMRADGAETMAHVKERDGGLCRYCGVQVRWSDRRSLFGGTYDHVIPICQGGSSEAENLVTACRQCNSAKGGRTPEEAGMKLQPVGYRLSTGSLPVNNQVETGSEAEPSPVSPSESDLDLQSSPENSPSLTSSSDLSGSPRVSRRRRRTILPFAWKPTPEHVKRASETGLDLDREVIRFRNYHEAKGSLMANWNAAFTTWLLNAVEFARPPGAIQHEKTRQEEARRPYHEPFRPEVPEMGLERKEALQMAQQAMAGIGRRL